MTEDQLISTLEALERAAKQSTQSGHSYKPFHVYVNAMQAVVARYQETNPYADTGDIEERIDHMGGGTSCLS